ncbi:MAG: hypothetical protein P4L99_12225 [Chthoniobacter sp.]|nr:hypothetical protein [Chthoniobacter sp.]
MKSLLWLHTLVHITPCLAVVLAGCASSSSTQSPPAGTFPIKTASNGGGMIESAALSIHGERVYVWGFVRRQSVVDPPMWAHVDVSVLDAAGNTTESTTVDYTPSDMPYGRHGQTAHSMFSAKLTKVPAPGSTILVAFNGNPKSSDRRKSQFWYAKEQTCWKCTRKSGRRVRSRPA